MNTKSKILIVDDAELNRSVLADILDEKYEIIEARALACAFGYHDAGSGRL